MQIEKSQPEGKQIMPEMRFTKFPALSIDPRVGISQPEGKRIMPETRFTEFPALSIDPRVGISLSNIGDRCLIIFLTYDIKSYYLSFIIFSIFDILHCITTFSECYSVFFMLVQK